MVNRVLNKRHIGGNRVLNPPLAKGIGAPPASGTAFANSQYRGAAVARPTYSHGAPTGSYPKHYWSTGPGVGPGARAIMNQYRGIMPGLPTGSNAGTGQPPPQH